MLKPNYALDFLPILLPLFMGEGIEDSETKPFLGFRLICPLSPRERVRERAVSRRLTFRFRKKSSERSSEMSSCQEAAHSENKQSKFRQHGTLKPFQKGKYDEIQSNPFIVYCRSFSYRRL